MSSIPAFDTLHRSVSTRAASSPTTTTSPKSNSTLGSDGFLQLMVAELKYQDPMQGMDTSQLMQQTATFTQVQQEADLAKQLKAMTNSDSMSRALAMIGHSVTATSSTSGSAVNGKVDSVSINGGVPTLNVGTNALSVDDVTKVQ